MDIPMVCNLQNKKGFTLIEVLIATLVLAIGLLSLATLAGTVIRGNSFSNKMTTATTLAQDKMEYLKNKTYTSTYLTNGNHSDPDNPIQGMSRSWSVATSGISPNSYKTVTVTVTWNPGSYSVALKTILAE